MWVLCCAAGLVGSHKSLKCTARGNAPTADALLLSQRSQRVDLLSLGLSLVALCKDGYVVGEWAADGTRQWDCDGEKTWRPDGPQACCYFELSGGALGGSSLFTREAPIPA